MRKWWIAYVALAVVIGCGGGGGGGGSTSASAGTPGGGPGGGETTGGVPTVNLATGTDVQIYYLSGAGRRAAGSQTAVLKNIRVQNGGTDQLPTSQTGTNVSIKLDGYTDNSFNFSSTLPAGAVNKVYTEFPFRVDQMLEEQGDGSLSTVFNGVFEVNPPLALDMTLYAGRQVTLQVNIHDQMLRYDGTNVVFDRALFEAENYDPIDNKMNAFLSDHVSFDLTAMANGKRPSMLNGQVANRVFFTGDQIAVSRGWDAVGTFNVLNPVFIEDGSIKQPSNTGGVPLPGSYTVVEPDPRDVAGLLQITSLQGRWREYTEVLGNVQNGSTVNMIVMPNSRRTNEMQVVAFSRNGSGQITEMWQGVAKFNGASSTVELYSLDQLDEGTGNNPATGTLTSFTVQNGVVTQGKFNITSAPAGFPLATSGDFVVFRRVN